MFYVTINHGDPIDIELRNSHTNVSFELGELEEDYTFISTLSSHDLSSIFSVICELNQGDPESAWVMLDASQITSDLE